MPINSTALDFAGAYLTPTGSAVALNFGEATAPAIAAAVGMVVPAPRVRVRAATPSYPVALDFAEAYTSPSGDEINLNFGESVTIPAVSAALALMVAAPRLRVEAQCVPAPVDGHVQIVIAAPVFVVIGAYDNRMTRFQGASASAAHQVGQRYESSSASGWDVGHQHAGGHAAPWRMASAQHAAASMATQSALPLPLAVELAYSPADQISKSSAACHQRANPEQQDRSGVFEVATGRAVGASIVGQVAVEHRRVLGSIWQRQGIARERQQHGRSGASPRLSGKSAFARWQLAGGAPAGRSVRPVVPVIPVRPGSTTLNFVCSLTEHPLPPAWAVRLNFGANPCGQVLAPLYILPTRFYMVVHALSAVRVNADGSATALPIYNASLSADRSSFGWSVGITGHSDLFDALQPVDGTPCIVRVTLDGIDWVMAVDKVRRTYEFGKRGASASGRSVTSLISAPFARSVASTNTSAMTAQQFAAAALDLTGIGLDWGIDDWLLPAGALSVHDTPLNTVRAVASAAGGYLQSHRSLPTLQVRHPYPVAPWDWADAVPDVSLAPDAIITGSFERADGPDVDAVYVSGTTAGVLALVKRSGTAGSKLADMQTMAGVTHVTAARQLGMSVLGAAGAKHLVEISLPVLTGTSQPGVLDVGQLVEVTGSSGWRGRVRAVNVETPLPKVRQTVTLERHLS